MRPAVPLASGARCLPKPGGRGQAHLRPWDPRAVTTGESGEVHGEGQDSRAPQTGCPGRGRPARPGDRACRLAARRRRRRGASPRRRRGRPTGSAGAVSGRAAVGHGARGLLPDRRGLGVLPARPGALARVPLGRGRPRSGISDNHQRLCFALALWNGRDPILKERLFGLTGPRATTARTSRSATSTSTPRRRTPTCGRSTSIRSASTRTRAWSRRTRGAAASEPEFELLDTGVFDDDRYFDVLVEYAKASPTTS